MASFNQITLIGHLTRDPEMRFLQNQTPVCSFSVATNHKYKTASGEERNDVTFMDCTAFGKRGEVINQYTKKGNPIFIVGRMRQETWEDKNGGGKRSKLSIIVENFQFLGGNRDGDDQRTDNRSPGRKNLEDRRSQRPPVEPEFDEAGQFAGDIPF